MSVTDVRAVRMMTGIAFPVSRSRRSTVKPSWSGRPRSSTRSAKPPLLARSNASRPVATVVLA
ncbi:Uncharacterised protein [Mycobacteroides abscessus]|nr:Uncharacterised protein [Mycobacteroides abscessus]